MNGRSTDLLKALVQGVPAGCLIDARWLARHGISRQLAHAYARAGWLDRVAYGVYRRPEPTTGVQREALTDWRVVLASAHGLMGHELHVGGLTALALRGHEHYLSLGEERVYVHSDVPPKWLKELEVDATLVFRKRTLFTPTSLAVEEWRSPVQAMGQNMLPALPVARPERAVLEAIDELPDLSFHHLDVIFESLANLRPTLLMDLLNACRKIQVKRLFLVFADRHQHAWRKYLDEARLDLGSGPRAFTAGGRLHPKYQITVPPGFHPDGGKEDVGGG